MQDIDEHMRYLRSLPRYKKDRMVRPRKVPVRAFLAIALGLSEQTIGRLFADMWYRPESVAEFLAERGYVPPKRGEKRRKRPTTQVIRIFEE